MSSLKRSVLNDVLAIAAIVLLILLSFFWNEARKDIIYLCGNAYPGIAKQTIIRHLNTSSLLQYDDNNVEFGSRVTANSLLHFGMFECEIEFNKADLVISTFAN